MTGTSDAPGGGAEQHTPHHRVHLVGVDGKAGATTVTLPIEFSAPLRPDLVRRAVVAAQSHRRQPYGTSLTAGRRHSVEWSGKGHGVSRSPRLMESNRGAQAPNTVGGGQAHPPRVDRIWTKKINRREARLAFASALAATRDPKLAGARGHAVPEHLHLPVVLEDPVEEIRTAQEARALLESLHLWAEIERAEERVTLRAGRARRRGRGRRVPRSLLIVTSRGDRARGFRNFAGVDIVPAERLSTEDLAPGGDGGRLTLFSQAGLQRLGARLGGGTNA